MEFLLFAVWLQVVDTRMMSPDITPQSSWTSEAWNGQLQTDFFHICRPPYAFQTPRIAAVITNFSNNPTHFSWNKSSDHYIHFRHISQRSPIHFHTFPACFVWIASCGSLATRSQISVTWQRSRKALTRRWTKAKQSWEGPEEYMVSTAITRSNWNLKLTWEYSWLILHESDWNQLNLSMFFLCVIIMIRIIIIWFLNGFKEDTKLKHLFLQTIQQNWFGTLSWRSLMFRSEKSIEGISPITQPHSLA